MPVGNDSTIAKPASRLRELGLVLPEPPSPLGVYAKASQVGPLLFLSGTLPLHLKSNRLSLRRRMKPMSKLLFRIPDVEGQRSTGAFACRQSTLIAPF
jgi:hypothetical protein